jgi:Flp pilus assembly protein TadG
MSASFGLGRSQEGASAIEFALVLPVFIMFLMSGFYASFGAFTVSNMHYAVEAGARCAAVSKGECSSAASTDAYVRRNLVSIGPVPSITVEDASCGKLVTGRVDYPVDLVFHRMTFPLSAQACHP